MTELTLNEQLCIMTLVEGFKSINKYSPISILMLAQEHLTEPLRKFFESDRFRSIRCSIDHVDYFTANEGQRAFYKLVYEYEKSIKTIQTTF